MENTKSQNICEFATAKVANYFALYLSRYNSQNNQQIAISYLGGDIVKWDYLNVTNNEIYSLICNKIEAIHGNPF